MLIVSNTDSIKSVKRGRSQDDVLGGCGICVSSQLGHIPGTRGGPWTPKGTGGTPSDWAGRGVWGECRGRRSGGGTGVVPLRSGWGKGKGGIGE